MDFLQAIIDYYKSESGQHSMLMVVTSGGLLLAALLLWFFSAPQSIGKGIAVPILLGVVLVLVAGTFHANAVKKEMTEKVALYQQNPDAFFEKEVQKVERIHQSWIWVRLTWAMIGVIGLILMLIIRKPFWTGIGIGAMFLGLLGNGLETISVKRNEIYRRQVLEQVKIK